jgi:hypothetical protein
MKQDVRVRFDQSGHQRGIRQINHLGAGRGFDFASWSNRFNLLATDEHYPAIVQLRRLAIEDVSGFEKVDGFGRFGLSLGLSRGTFSNYRECDDETKKAKEPKAHFMILSSSAFLIADLVLAFGAQLGSAPSRLNQTTERIINGGVVRKGFRYLRIEHDIR